MTRRLVAGAGGVALIASLFLPWFDVGGWFSYFDEVSGAPAFSGWEAFATLDVVLVACAVAAIGGSDRFAGPAAWIALLVVVTRATIPGPDIGVWVALAASLLMLARAEPPRWRPQRADAIALAGGLLLFGALFGDWYDVNSAGGLEPLRLEPLSAWSVLELTPVALAVAAAVAVIRRSVPAAVVAVALTAYAVFTAPDTLIAAWLAVAGSVLLLVGTGSNRVRARPQVAP